MSESKCADRSRRRILRSLAALPAVPLVLSESSAGAQAKRRPGAIDLHFHIQNPIDGRLPPPGPTVWSAQKALELMDQNGVATGMSQTGALSYVWEHDIPLGRRMAREWNEYGARLMQDHPGRFGLLALLPMGDNDGCLAEIAYAMDVLKADGFGLHNNYGSRWLGDPHFKPVFEELNRRKAVVHLHPSQGAPCCTETTLNYSKPGSLPVYEWFMDTARAIISLMTYGVIKDMPDIRFIFSHDGGAMPMMVGRILAAYQSQMLPTLPEDIEGNLRKLYFDIAQGTYPPSFGIISKLVPETHLLWGSDYPPVPEGMKLTREGLDHLRLPPRLRHAIERGNAEKLFPRLRA